MKRIAIFGGTFNPFHNAHFEVLDAVSKSNLADEILLMPTKLPPHKQCDFLADENHRLKMCALAAQQFANVTACDMELKMQGKSYTFNTVSELKRSNDSEILFVCGGDMITTFNRWYRYEELLKMMGIIAVRRKGIDNEEFDKAVEFLKAKGGKVFVLEITPAEISSSEIRQMKFDDMKKHIPAFIAEYISENGLYGGEQYAK